MSFQSRTCRDQLSFLYQPNCNQNQSAGAGCCHWWGRWLDFSVIQPRTEKFLKTASVEDPKLCLLLFPSISFLSCTWRHKAAVANHGCFKVKAGLQPGQGAGSSQGNTQTNPPHKHSNLWSTCTKILVVLFFIPFFFFSVLLSSIHIACHLWHHVFSPAVPFPT